MKKIIITIMALVMMLGLTSCGETRSVSKSVTRGSNEVHVTESTIVDGERHVDKSYTITFETPDEAWNYVYGK